MPLPVQRHSISCSTSSGCVAQLVAMRITVWESSVFSQNPISTFSDSAAACAFSSRMKIWFVGVRNAKRYPFSSSAWRIFPAASIAFLPILK